jgi:putative protease
MKAIVYLTSASEIPLWVGANVTEVIIAPRELSRRGTMSMGEARSLAGLARAAGLRPLLEWDALMEGPRLRACTALVAEVHADFAVLRVRDAGAALWGRDNTSLPLQLLLEAGHHNLPALESWRSRLGDRIERFCLSPELPLQTLTTWRSQLPVQMEVLGLGPLLLFHSPRALLSPHEQAGTDVPEVWAEGASEESPHKGFLLAENSHGTLMFHPKDLGIIDRWDDIDRAGVDYVRLDHRREQVTVAQELAGFLASGDPTALRAAWSREWMRGYLDVNKSDVLFHRLKNDHLASHVSVCGEVLEGKREKWLAVRARGTLVKGETLELVNPKGERRPLKLAWLKDDGFQAVESLVDGQVGFVPWEASTPAKSQLRRLS